MNLLITLILNAGALYLTSYIVPGFHVNGIKTAFVAAIVLGIINTFIKPVLLFLTAPLNFLTLGLFTFVINAIMLWLASLLTPGHGIIIDSALSAVVAAAVLSVVSTILSMLVHDLERAGRKTRR